MTCNICMYCIAFLLNPLQKIEHEIIYKIESKLLTSHQYLITFRIQFIYT